MAFNMVLAAGYFYVILRRKSLGKKDINFKMSAERIISGKKSYLIAAGVTLRFAPKDTFIN
jgi:hypothetical protein